MRVSHRLSVHLQDIVDQVDDPVVCDSSPGVETGFLPAIQREARQGHLHHELGAARVRHHVVAGPSGHDGDIRLRLGLLVQSDGQLGLDVPVGSERRAKRPGDQSNPGRVRPSLWLADDQLAAEQLQALVGCEGAQVDQALVLQARPALRTDGRLGDLAHGRRSATGTATVGAESGHTVSPALSVMVAP